MSEYIVSARKYRPLTFDTVVGQQALTTTLKNAVASGKLAHAYLFCGPRGVGKTTCARIFARVINCEHPTPEGEACGECESCKAFLEQRSFNIFELDAASNNGVNEIKDLMEQTRIPPQIGRYKVFIIDEVHMLSTAAFNAFLKTLEEPPQHVIFILATTEKHKILPTILSRCQIYDFERMTVQNTVNHLKSVAEKEGIQYEERALALIAEKADGGMRDALSIFDQAASFCQGNITYDKVMEDLNVLDADNYFRLVDLSLENKIADIMLLLNDIIGRGFDPGHLVNGLASHVRNVMMARDASTLPLLECSEEQRQRYHEQSQKCSQKFMYEALKLMNQCDLGYRQSSNKRLLVELTLIQVAQITQPEEPASAGRSPKSLKPLFKFLFGNEVSRQQNAAPRVAAPAAVRSTQDQNAQPQVQQQSAAAKVELQSVTAPHPAPEVSTAKQEPPVSPPSAPKPAFDGSKVIFSTSFASLRNLGKQNPNTATAENDTKPIASAGTPEAEQSAVEKRFTQEDLEREWLAMCLRMPHQYVAIASRMKNLMPVITDYPAVEVVVESKDMQQNMLSFRKRVEATLRRDLHNEELTIDIRMAEANEVKKVLTRPELFAEMMKENPALDFLRQKLGLELM